MCNCDVKYYSPVCSKEDQLTFYSPCYAGCTADDALGDKVRVFKLFVFWYGFNIFYIVIIINIPQMFQVNIIIYFILLELVDQELHFNIFRRNQQDIHWRGKKCRATHLYQFSHSSAQPLGGAVASWLVRSSPDRAVWVQTLARGHCVVFLGKTLNSHCASLHPGV